MECLAPLDAGAAPAAMATASLVAGPCLCKWHPQARTLADDVGLTQVQERRFESDLRKPIKRSALHPRKSIDE
jgi:hypothetical protein